MILFSFLPLLIHHTVTRRPRPVQFNPLLEVIDLLACEAVAELVREVGKMVRVFSSFFSLDRLTGVYITYYAHAVLMSWLRRACRK